MPKGNIASAKTETTRPVYVAGAPRLAPNPKNTVPNIGPNATRNMTHGSSSAAMRRIPSATSWATSRNAPTAADLLIRGNSAVTSEIVITECGSMKTRKAR